MSQPPRRVLVLLLAALALGEAVSAQLARPGQPATARNKRLVEDELPALVLPHPDVERMRAEDDAHPSAALRYGAVIPCSFGCDDSGRWDALPSGELVWRLRLSSPGACSLGALFTEYELPRGGELYLYGPGGSPLFGAFTAESRQPNGMLAVQPVSGDELWIEYVQPAGADVRPHLVLGEVVHDYRGILQDGRPTEPRRIEASCLFDVNCPQGADYQDIKRSVIMVIAGGVQCSAWLVNNTSNDGTPYFVTANHAGDMTNVVAFFGFENTGCGTGGASTSKTISGATLLAASSIHDSQLYRLSSTPPQSFEPFFAGWERGATQPAPAISISHPNGSPKKLALDFDGARSTVTWWEVTWEFGKIAYGSSGSPLFNGDERAIGTLCCLTLFTCGDQTAYYGRFGAFYDKNGLGPFLDPTGTGAHGIDGYDPFQAQVISYDGSGVNPKIYRSNDLPTIGTTWDATIDTSAMPTAGSTVIVGHPTRSSGTFGAPGELLVDLGTPRVFQSIATVVGGASQHSNAIPSDPALSGQTCFTQGVVLLGGGARKLTNGIELRLR